MLSRIINFVRNVVSPPRYWYAVRDKQTRAWLVDTCAGGTFDIEFGRSTWFDEPDEVVLALVSADIPRDAMQLVRLHVQPNTNHYAMKDLPW